MSLIEVIDVDKPSNAATFRRMTLRVVTIIRTLNNATLDIMTLSLAAFIIITL